MIGWIILGFIGGILLDYILFRIWHLKAHSFYLRKKETEKKRLEANERIEKYYD